jgi:glycosyltransferase involved in cell wall biosynthesis
MMEDVCAPISVIIPCYKCASTIDRALDSVAGQSLKPSEVILVDDSSGDETLNKLRNLEHRNPGWVKIVSLPVNKGAATARNAGWSVATQPYIAFLDADDSWHPDKLKIQYACMQGDSEITLCGSYCVWLRFGEKPNVLPRRWRMTKISKIGLLFKSAFSTPTMMVLSRVPFRFQEGRRRAEDSLLLQQIAFADLNVTRVELPLAFIHKPSFGASGLSENLWSMEREEMKNFIYHYKARKIGVLLFLCAVAFSVLKFVARVVRVGGRKILTA